MKILYSLSTPFPADIRDVEYAEHSGGSFYVAVENDIEARYTSNDLTEMTPLGLRLMLYEYVDVVGTDIVRGGIKGEFPLYLPEALIRMRDAKRSIKPKLMTREPGKEVQLVTQPEQRSSQLTPEQESICQWAVWNVDKDNTCYLYKKTFSPRHMWNNIKHFALLVNAVLATLSLMTPAEVTALAQKAEAELDLIRERPYDPVTKQYDPDWLDELIDNVDKPEAYADIRRDAIKPISLNV